MSAPANVVLLVCAASMALTLLYLLFGYHPDRDPTTLRTMLTAAGVSVLIACVTVAIEVTR